MDNISDYDVAVDNALICNDYDDIANNAEQQQETDTDIIFE